MESNKGFRKLLAMMFARMSAKQDNGQLITPYSGRDFTPEEKFQKQEDRKLSQGLKKFYYGDKYVIALNQYNADRKAKNLGLI